MPPYVTQTDAPNEVNIKATYDSYIQRGDKPAWWNISKYGDWPPPSYDVFRINMIAATGKKSGLAKGGTVKRKRSKLRKGGALLFGMKK